MERSDATHVTVGGILFGAGGVGISILIPLAVAAKHSPWCAAWFLAPLSMSLLFLLIGSYMLVAVYTDWPLPLTAQERRAAASAERVRQNGILARLRTEYIASHDGISPQMLAGTEPLPKAWVEGRLAQLRETWRRRQY